MTALRRLIFLILCGSLGSAAPAAADTVTDWNAIAADSISRRCTSSRGGSAPRLCHGPRGDARRRSGIRETATSRMLPHIRRRVRLAEGRCRQGRARCARRTGSRRRPPPCSASTTPISPAILCRSATRGELVGQEAALANHREAGE